MAGTNTASDSLDETGLGQKPLLLGVLLAPIGGAAGTLLAATLGNIDAGAPPLLLAVLAGTLAALPVTALLFPIMYGAYLEGAAYPCLGALAGAVIALPFQGGLSGLGGGAVAGLVFMWATRSDPAEEQPPATGSTPPGGASLP